MAALTNSSVICQLCCCGKSQSCGDLQGSCRPAGPPGATCLPDRWTDYALRGVDVKADEVIMWSGPVVRAGGNPPESWQHLQAGAQSYSLRGGVGTEPHPCGWPLEAGARTYSLRGGVVTEPHPCGWTLQAGAQTGSSEGGWLWLERQPAAP